MQDPEITIVVPVYKVEEGMLRQCLDSIAAQTSDNFEAILIDDGSPDRCGAICDEYAAEHDNFRAVHQENGGLAVVRNNGVSLARGNWVCFVDGDDWIEPDTVAFAEKYIRRCGDGDMLLWDEYFNIGNVEKKNCHLQNYHGGIRSFSGEGKMELFDMFFPRIYRSFPGHYIDLGCAHARLYRVRFLKDKHVENRPGLRRMQDNVFNLWAIEKAERVYYVKKRLYHYRFNAESATQKYAPDNVATMLFLYDSMEDFVKRTHDNEDFHQRLYCRFIRIFGEIFKLNFASPGNPKPLGERISDAAAAFDGGKFREAIDRFDSRGQSGKLRFIHMLLERRAYPALILYYSVSIRTRKVRTMLKK